MRAIRSSTLIIVVVLSLSMPVAASAVERARPAVTDGSLFAGYAFWDLNVNGTWDADEPARGGVRITVRNESGQVVWQMDTIDLPGTAPHGTWSLPTSLGEGIYTISESTPSGWVRTHPDTNGGVYRIHLNADGTYELLSTVPTGYDALDFGNARPMGYKFQDDNANAQYDTGERQIGDWPILLRSATSGAVVLETRTRSSYGMWYLTKALAEGDYWVEERTQGWTQTYPATQRYLIHLDEDGDYFLLSTRPSWFDGLSFGNRTSDIGEPSCPACPNKVLFQSDRADGYYHIFALDADGAVATQLTSGDYNDVSPTWSFDAQSVAYASQRDGDWEIHVMSADGSGQTNLSQQPLAADGTSPSQDLAPSWGCEDIVFQSDRDGNWEIYRMDAEGALQVRLTEDDAADVAPSWSPDESRIAFQSDRGGDGDWDLYIMNAAGGEVQQLTDDAGDERNPTWSPDGEWVAFETNRDGQWDLYKVNVESGEQVRLTDSPAADTGVVWMPYCDSIVFQSDRSGEYDVHSLDDESGEVEDLTGAAGSDLVDYVPGNASADAMFDAVTLDEDTVAQWSLLENDLGLDGVDAGLVIVTASEYGAVEVAAGGFVTYTPDADYWGADAFIYGLVIEGAIVDESGVSVTVNAVNDAPDAAGDRCETSADVPVRIDVLANDADPDGDLLATAIVSGPAHGQASVNVDGSVRYEPESGFWGADAFAYAASDPSGASCTAIVHVNVRPLGVARNNVYISVVIGS